MKMDALIVGAGCDGAVVAKRLAAHGLQVLVIDKCSHITPLFQGMLEHPNIRVEVEIDYFEWRGKLPARHTVYTGPIDRYYGHCFGKLLDRLQLAGDRCGPHARAEHEALFNKYQVLAKRERNVTFLGELVDYGQGPRAAAALKAADAVLAKLGTRVLAATLPPGLLPQLLPDVARAANGQRAVAGQQ